VLAYEGHDGEVIGVVEKGYDTLISASYDKTLKTWSTTTCECIDTVDVEIDGVHSMVKAKNDSSLAIGLGDGHIQLRRFRDLRLLLTFKPHRLAVCSLCELEDGSFLSGSADSTVKRWDATNGNVLRTFTEHRGSIRYLIELRSGVVLSSEDGCDGAALWIWNVSTGAHVHELYINAWGVEKIAENMFITGLMQEKSLVWEDNKCIQFLNQNENAVSMLRLKNASIVSAGLYGLSIRQS